MTEMRVDDFRQPVGIFRAAADLAVQFRHDEPAMGAVRPPQREFP